VSPPKANRLPPDLDNILRRGVIEIIPEQEFIDALASGRKLRLKLGLDPSKPDLHIGHAVLLRKLRRLQELGHQVVLIVGDWTAQIGDPSGQSIMRPMLTADEVKANAETYMRQFFHVVDRDKTEVRWQSEWFGSFTLEDVVRLAGRFTVAQMLQREDFRQRFDAHKPLGIHELLYPLLQAHDSVVIEADVEFGGSDQRFNLLVGRELQEELGQRPQVCFIMHLLVGTDGAQKMSKSLGNTIDLEDPPHEQYGKVMSIPDSALLDYLELTTDIPDEELEAIRRQIEDGVNPLPFKKRLAREIVQQFHGKSEANWAQGVFEMTYRDHQDGEIIPLPEGTVTVPVAFRGQRINVNLVQLIRDSGLVGSVSEARRLIKQGAVELVGVRPGPALRTSVQMVAPEQVNEPNVSVEEGQVFRVGKHRFLRIVDADAEKTS
jgi:tyrosyl-tRNA synthetase